MKRYRVGTAGRGRGRPYRKRRSHIKIVLTDEVPSKSLEPRVKGKTKFLNLIKRKGKQLVPRL